MDHIELPQVSPLLPDTFTLFKVHTKLDVQSANFPHLDDRFKDFSQYLSPRRSNDATIVHSLDEYTADTTNHRSQYLIKPKFLKGGPFKKVISCAIQCYKWSLRSEVEALFAEIDPKERPREERIEFHAGLIIFPMSETNAMIYGFGQWTSLINRRCIIPNWGLRVLASERFFNPETVKKIAYYSSKNDKLINTHQSSKSYPLVDELEPDDRLSSIRITPNGFNPSHDFEGKDYLHFTLPKGELIELSTEILETYITQLRSLAQQFLNFESTTIHQDLKPYVYELVTDKELLPKLQQEFLRQRYDVEFIKLHPKLTQNLGSKKPWLVCHSQCCGSSSNPRKTNNLFELFFHLCQELSPLIIKDVVNFDTIVHVLKTKHDETTGKPKVKLLDVVVSKTFNYEGNQYFLELGHFFYKPVAE
ncbi:hypothetical protein P9112_000435 [Eukaryota sp. TZLM1-RC]